MSSLTSKRVVANEPEKDLDVKVADQKPSKSQSEQAKPTEAVDQETAANSVTAVNQTTDIVE